MTFSTSWWKDTKRNNSFQLWESFFGHIWMYIMSYCHPQINKGMNTYRHTSIYYLLCIIIIHILNKAYGINLLLFHEEHRIGRQHSIYSPKVIPTAILSYRKEWKLGSHGISYLWIALQLFVSLVFGTPSPSSTGKTHLSGTRVTSSKLTLKSIISKLVKLNGYNNALLSCNVGNILDP